MAANNALQKIQSATKKLRKEHPKMTYQAALQKASKMYRSGSLGATKAKPKAKVKKKVAAVKVASTKVVAKRPGITVSGIEGKMNSDINRLEKERKEAKTQTEKNRIQRRINACHDVIDGIKKLK